MRTALIDGDMIRYTLGFACQEVWPSGAIETSPEHQWKRSVDLFLKGIVAGSGSSGPPKVYLTGKGNFREAVAKKKPYKGTRKAEKPALYEEISTYLIDTWAAEVIEGMEADDALAINQTEDTIICSNDKDLRMVAGWHYSWPVGDRIGERLPYAVDTLGSITATLKEGGKIKKVEATGLRMFYYQLLIGDSVDNIPGCPKVGPVKAYEALYTLDTETEMYNLCLSMYQDKYPENALEELLEQAHLLWMVDELDNNGAPIMWTPPTETADDVPVLNR